MEIVPQKPLEMGSTVEKVFQPKSTRRRRLRRNSAKKSYIFQLYIDFWRFYEAKFDWKALIRKESPKESFSGSLVFHALPALDPPRVSSAHIALQNEHSKLIKCWDDILGMEANDTLGIKVSLTLPFHLTFLTILPFVPSKFSSFSTPNVKIS